MNEDKISNVIEPAVKWKLPAAYANMDLGGLFSAKCAELGLTKFKASSIIGIDSHTLDSVLNMKKGGRIDFVNVIKVSNFLGIPIEDIARSYTDYMSVSQISEIQRAREAGYIVSHFDVNGLCKSGFVGNKQEANLSRRIVRFFGLTNIYEYSEKISVLFPAFSRTKRSSDDKMRDFWVFSAYAQFEGLNNPNDYDREELKLLVPKIRAYSQNVKNGLYVVSKALFSVGVTVIFQKSLERVQVRGATMCVNGKPCIVLSDLNKHYSTLWFALMHEIYHVLFDFEEISKRSYHLSGDNEDLFLTDETRADNFASQYLLDDSRRNFASQYITSDYLIDKLAKNWGIHPSIIYSAYAHDNNKGAFYNKCNPGVDSAVKLLNTHVFEKETIAESVEELSELLNN